MRASSAARKVKEPHYFRGDLSAQEVAISTYYQLGVNGHVNRTIDNLPYTECMERVYKRVDLAYPGLTINEVFSLLLKARKEGDPRQYLPNSKKHVTPDLIDVALQDWRESNS